MCGILGFDIDTCDNGSVWSFIIIYCEWAEANIELVKSKRKGLQEVMGQSVITCRLSKHSEFISFDVFKTKNSSPLSSQCENQWISEQPFARDNHYGRITDRVVTSILYSIRKHNRF